MRNFTIGRLFGVDICINLWLIVFLGCILLFSGVINFLVFTLVFLCVLLHEFGHIAVAKYYKIKCNKIILTPIGGLAIINDKNRKYNPLREFLIAIGGPMVNVFLVLLSICANILSYDFLGHYLFFFNFMITINTVLFLLNLIPAYPMDGGRIFKSILAIFFDYKKSGRIAGITGTILGILMAVFFAIHFSPMGILIGAFISLMAYSEYANNKNTNT